MSPKQKQKIFIENKNEKNISIINSLPASVNFCHLLIIFANSLDQDQDRQDVGPDLEPNCVTLIVLLKEFFRKSCFWKKSDDKKIMENYPSCKEL